MEQTSSQHLPYPDENDPAAWALQLQVLAEAIDAKLVDDFAAFRNVINTPALVVNLSTNQTGIATTGDDIFFDQILYMNGAWTLTPTYLVFPETGYYRIGTYIVSNPSAGVTANSSVIVTLRYVYVPSYPFYSRTVEDFETRNWQSSTGGEHMVAEGLIRVDTVNPYPSSSSPSDYSMARVRIGHANVASTLNVIAGSKMWGYKVSELED